MKYFDCHADTLTQITNSGESLANNTCNIDLNRVEKFAEQYTQIFAIWKDRKKIDSEQLEHEFYHHYTRAMNLLKAESDRIVLCKNASEMQRAKEEGKMAAFLSIEDLSFMGTYVEQIRTLGFSFAMLTWNYENEYGCGASTDQGKGLSRRGKQTAKELLDQGIILDCSHLSDRGIEDVFELTDKPVIASHSNVREICQHPRNLKKEQIQEFIRRQGLIGMNFYRYFVGGKEDAQFILRHMDVILNLGGEDALVLGGDFDGCGEDLTEGIDGVESMPYLYEEMEKARFGKKLLDKIWFENAEKFVQKNLTK